MKVKVNEKSVRQIIFGPRTMAITFLTGITPGLLLEAVRLIFGMYNRFGHQAIHVSHNLWDNWLDGI